MSITFKRSWLAAAVIGLASVGASAQTSVVAYDSLTGSLANPYGMCLGGSCSLVETVSTGGGLYPPLGSPAITSIGDYIQFNGAGTVLTGFQYGIFLDAGFSGFLNLQPTLNLYKNNGVDGLASIPLGSVQITVGSAVNAPGFVAVIAPNLNASLDLTSHLTTNSNQIYYSLSLNPQPGSSVSGFGVALRDETNPGLPTVGVDISTTSVWTSNPLSPLCVTCGAGILQVQSTPIDQFTPAVQFLVTPAIPEPSQYMMLLAGLVGVGALARRNKKA